MVGPTGAGKSTIAKLVTRFYDPHRGARAHRRPRPARRHPRLAARQLGVVPQEPFLFHGSIRDNLAFARPDATDEEVRAAACRAVGLDDLLDRLPEGLDTPVHERGSSLSSGERQLLALARAFLARPPGAGARRGHVQPRPAPEAEIEQALDVVLEGRTAIVIAHRLATAMRADRIAVVDDGGSLELGTHDELVALGGRYADMYAVWEQHSRTGAQPA